jgi:8-oxo-dGTP pyrophosphatase MutT (NUDIX family)
MKIPGHAKRVFKGIIFDVYQWEQKMFDGSTATFERLKRPGTVEVIPVIGDKILLAREQQPDTDELYTFFGGRQEEGEEPLATAKRELLEEAGLASDDWQLIQTYEPVGKIDWTISVFVARNCRNVAAQKLDAGEKIQIEEVGFDAFVDIVTRKDFWEREFSHDLYRMKHEGKLDQFRRRLTLPS